MNGTARQGAFGRVMAAYGPAACGTGAPVPSGFAGAPFLPQPVFEAMEKYVLRMTWFESIPLPLPAVAMHLRLWHAHHRICNLVRLLLVLISWLADPEFSLQGP